MIRFLNKYSFSKIYDCPKKALHGLKDGHSILVGGFGVVGIPMNLINAIR